MHLRPYAPHDISALASIEASVNLEDPLSLYMTKNIEKYPTSYRAGCVRFLRTKLLMPGIVGWVVETDEGDEISNNVGGDGKSGGGEVVGWAIWERKGKGMVARNWQRMGEGRKLELALSTVTNKYHSLFDPTLHATHIALVQPILARPHLPIFAESWELCGLYISRAYQRRGLGTLLLQWGLDQATAERVSVTVRSSPSGMHLYERKGFRAFENLGFERFFDTGEKGMKGLVWEPAGMEGRWFESARAKAGEYEEKEKERGRARGWIGGSVNG